MDVVSPRRFLHLFCLALLTVSARSNGETSGRVRLFTGAGLDTNARRDYAQGEAPESDVMTSVIASGEIQRAGEQSLLSGGYDFGVRKFLRLPSEDVRVQSLKLEGSLALGQQWGVGMEARGKDRRGGARDYTDLEADAFLEFVPDPRLDLRVEGGGHRFIYWPAFEYSWAAAEWSLHGRFRFNPRHAVLLWGELGERRFNGRARPRPGAESEDPPMRSDFGLTIGAGYSYRGPIALSLNYGYTELSSNSFGETTLRHHVTGNLGVRLPWRVMLLTQITLQLTRYPDGVYLSPEINLIEDDENHNSLSLKLVKPLSANVDLELRWALFHNSLPQNNLTYLRQTGGIGLGWRL